MPDSLPLRLDRASSQPLYRQLERQLRGAIEDGRLRPGAYLPGVRGLARSLGVGRITVTTAYDELIAEGYLVGEVGRGTRVTRRPPARVPPGAAADRASLPAAPPVRRAPRPDLASIDLRPGRPAAIDFPYATWERLLREAVRELARGPHDGAAIQEATDAGGDPILRERLAGWLGIARGVRTGPEQIFVTSGDWASLSTYLDARDETARTLEPAAPSDRAHAATAYVEDPALPHVARLLGGRGRTLLPVPADASGLLVGRLVADQAADRVVHVTPAWNPIAGGALSDDRRRTLVEWAQGADRIVEDDRDGDLRFAGPPPAALAATGDRVALVRGFERDLFPGARLGMLAVPADDVSKIRRLVGLDARGPGAIEQRALARFLEAGLFDRQRRRMRRELADRQSVLLEALARECGGRLGAAAVPAGRSIVARILVPGLS